MQEGHDFINELLLEAEQKETELSFAHFDLIIKEISDLYNLIARTIKEAESEIEIINDWALNRNVKHQEKIEFLQKKLEAFIRSQNQKTINLPHGTLKIRKKADKVEITDMDEFLKSATQMMLTVVPESVKPNLNGIKTAMKMSGKVPKGVEVIEGTEEFSLKIKEVNNDSTN
ncbi:MAG: host-nuclease inhibitor Gam family protein [Bacteroidetes bacterium]|nr:host-nuclease inhibitor Gam family protein [Bacteroidota bacterium]